MTLRFSPDTARPIRLADDEPIEWRVVRDRFPNMPGPEDLLATVLASDRHEARTTAERLFPLERITVVLGKLWPLEGKR